MCSSPGGALETGPVLLSEEPFAAFPVATLAAFFFGTPFLSARGPFWRFCGRRDACCVAGRVVVGVPDVQPLLRSSPERQGRWSTTLCQSVPGPALHQPGGLTCELVDPRHGCQGCPLCQWMPLRF